MNPPPPLLQMVGHGGTVSRTVEQQTRKWPNCIVHHESAHQNDFCTCRDIEGHVHVPPQKKIFFSWCWMYRSAFTVTKFLSCGVVHYRLTHFLLIIVWRRHVKHRESKTSVQEQLKSAWAPAALPSHSAIGFSTSYCLACAKIAIEMQLQQVVTWEVSYFHFDV